jgi:hypothetical protein
MIVEQKYPISSGSPRLVFHMFITAQMFFIVASPRCLYPLPEGSGVMQLFSKIFLNPPIYHPVDVSGGFIGLK